MRKIATCTCTVKFDKKKNFRTLELMWLPQILNLPGVLVQLPDKLKNNDRICQFHSSWWGCVFINTYQCEYTDSSFCHPRHKYIVIGDLRIIKNKKLRNLPTKSPNCREPWTINLSKASVEINIAVDTCIKLWHLKLCILPQTLHHGKRKY